MEAYTKENIKAESTESVVESTTDLDMECKLNGEVKKVEASRILAESFNENKLHSTVNFKKARKKIINASGINMSGTDIQPYCNLCNKIYNSLDSLKVHK